MIYNWSWESGFYDNQELFAAVFHLDLFVSLFMRKCKYKFPTMACPSLPILLSPVHKKQSSCQSSLETFSKLETDGTGAQGKQAVN